MLGQDIETFESAPLKKEVVFVKRSTFKPFVYMKII